MKTKMTSIRIRIERWSIRHTGHTQVHENKADRTLRHTGRTQVHENKAGRGTSHTGHTQMHDLQGFNECHS